MQYEFLRMCGQVQRLQRIIHASRQYLIAREDSKSEFKFKPYQLESLNDYIGDILADYKNRIQIEDLIQDQSFWTDPYWLSVCITNLVKNSLIHGKSPVKIKFELQGDNLQVIVSDSGQLDKNFKELLKPFHKGEKSEGLGLGLVIVDRIIQLMQGELRIENNPTTFKFIVKEVKDETNINH